VRRGGGRARCAPRLRDPALTRAARRDSRQAPITPTIEREQVWQLIGAWIDAIFLMDFYVPGRADFAPKQKAVRAKSEAYFLKLLDFFRRRFAPFDFDIGAVMVVFCNEEVGQIWAKRGFKPLRFVFPFQPKVIKENGPTRFKA
jgi:hypothetical protein